VLADDNLVLRRSQSAMEGTGSGQAQRRFDPVSLGIVALLLMLCGATVFLWTTATSGVRGVRQARNVDAALSQAGWQIRYLDEVLTHSAARFAATGDARWKLRYDDAVGVLDRELAASKLMASQVDLAALANVDDANQALIEMETEVFELAGRGQLAEAQLVLGPLYEEQKAVYKRGVDVFFAAQQDRISVALTDQEERLRINLSVQTGVCIILFFALLGLGRVHRRERALTTSQANTLMMQGIIDPLTGLLNRRGGTDVASERLAVEASDVAVLFVDIDGFKAINDSFGHHAGDELLAALAKRFAALVGDSGVLARLGGDEFLVIVHPDDANAVAGRLLAAACEPVALSTGTVSVSGSFGIAVGASDGVSGLMKRADLALYAAKGQGKNQVVVFDAAMAERHEATAALERDMQRALVNREFELHLQPIVRTASGHIEGAEALVRWRHPAHGLLLPGDFLAVAEASWLIVEIGRQVLLGACQQLAQWHMAGRPLTIAVNVSARHVVHADLVADIEVALRRSGAPAGFLQIELTETKLVSHLDRAVEVLTRVQALGVSVSLDDFGEGHSSFGYLRSLPLNALKIDRSYISGIDTNPAQYALVSNMIEMSRVFGLSVVAEGVERIEELKVMQQLGCDVSQGYFIARPMEAEQFDRWVTDCGLPLNSPATATGDTTSLLTKVTAATSADHDTLA
jgi:diguanylate cyclase (GGDEF)-like protein